MNKGTHDGNLITNNDAVGRTVGQVSNQTNVECEFRTSSGRKLNPDSVNIKIYNGSEIIEETIGLEQSDLPYGMRSGSASSFNSYFKIQDGVLTITFHQSSGTSTITSINPIEIVSLTKDGREYSNFVFAE